MKKSRFLILMVIFLIGGVLVLLLSSQSFLQERQQEIGCHCVDQETASGDFAENESLAFFESKPITPLLSALPEPVQTERVMGVSNQDKWVEVDLSEQKLIAWEQDKIFLETPVSSGKWYPTPQGEYRIWSKFKYTKMEGGVKGTGTYYYLPNVPYTMFFHNGFGLHGTYWHNNFGTPMSHGCINLPTVMAEKLFYWAEPSLPLGKNAIRASSDSLGTKIVIHE